MPRYNRRGTTVRYGRKMKKRYGMRNRGFAAYGIQRNVGIKRSALTQHIHHFKRRWSVATSDAARMTLTNNPNGFINASHWFQLNGLVNHTEFTTLYDQYRINKVVLELKWSGAIEDVNERDLNNPPMLYYVRDYDDATALSENEFRENCRTKTLVLKPSKIYKLVIVPAQLHQVYSSVVSSGYAIKWKQWTDVGNVSVPHYGFKFGVKYPANEAYGTIEVSATYYFSCKNAR